MTGGAASLAVLGAAPAFPRPLHVGLPNIGDRQAFLDRVDEILSARRFTNDGPCVRELEARLAEYLGVRHCVLVGNGTTAICLLARATELRGEVIVPSFTFVATAHAFEWLGISPVFCDIDASSWTLDAAACQDAIGPETSAVMGVHLFGRSCDVGALQALADENGLRLFFDAAHAFGCTHEGRAIGGFGDAEVFSFHATKAFHTFEGGAVTTSDDGLASRIRLLRNFGFTDFDEVTMRGINGKMPEVCAAMGLANLAAFERTVEASRACYEEYRSRLATIPGVALREFPPGERHNWHYVVLEVDDDGFGLDRDSLVRVLWADGVLARRYFYPGVHAMEPYRGRDPGVESRLPRTVRAAARALVLPAGESLSADQVDGVVAILRTAHDRADEVRRALAAAGRHAPPLGRGPDADY